MSPAMRARLQAAFDHVGDRKRAGATAATIITELVQSHKATFNTMAWTNTLRVAGVATSNTASKDDGLLDAWMRRAATKLMEPEGGYASE